MITVCVPVLRRYDLLQSMLLTLQGSTVRPDAIFVIDNGQDAERVAHALQFAPAPTTVHAPKRPMGLAESWNWFIENVEEERLIVNDDVTFSPTSLAHLAVQPGDLVSGLLGTHAFSCFLFRDSCLRKVGLFDENISPGYAYFEDLDYRARMHARGMEIVGVECGVEHAVSQTLRSASESEVEEHHRRFLIAQANYVRKWGALPTGVVRA